MDPQIVAAFIAALATVVTAIIAVRHQRQYKEDAQPAPALPDLADYFIAGCGVGNAIAVLPLPGSERVNDSLEELLHAFRRIGLSQPRSRSCGHRVSR